MKEIIIYYSELGKKIKALGLLLLALSTCVTCKQATAQTATNYAAVDSVKVGDTFHYSIVTESPTDYKQILFPDTSQFGDPIRVVNRKRYKVNNFVDSLSYTLQYFGTQSYTIPKLPVRFVADQDTTTLYVPPVPLDFKTTLKSQNDTLLPLKPIFEFAINWWPYALGFVLLMILGYLGYRWYQKQAAKEKEPAPPFTPQPFVDPLDELRKNLQTIRNNLDMIQQGEFKRFYSEVGDALRLYLERVYRIPALESTTRELLDDLRQESAPEPIIDKTKTVLREADMVKFARYTPATEQAERALNEADHFLEIAQHQDRRRIEYLRSKHESEQEKRKKAYEENSSIEEVTNNV